MEGEFNSYISDEELTSVFTLDSFSAYIKEISKYPLLSIEEIKELARQYKKGDNLARQKILNANLRLELMAIYDIKEKEFMSGKEIGHVYKILNNIDKCLIKSNDVKIKRLVN